VDSSELTLAVAYQRARREFGDSQVVSRADGTVVTQSYTELFARVDRLAWALASLGISPGDRVGTLAWNHHRHLEIYLAATSCGAVLHTINLRLPADSAIAIARHARDKVIFVDADQAALLEAVATTELSNLRTVVRMGAADAGLTATCVPVLDYEALPAGQPEAAFGYPELRERMPAATCYSSATTGTPKGVVYSHRGLLMHSMALALADTWAISRSDTVLPVVPMFHVNAWGLPFTALWMGSRLVLPGARPAAADLLDLLVGQRVMFVAAVPTVWMDVLRLVRAQGRPLPSLRMVVSGGAPLPRTLLEDADDLDIPMIHSYGMTEIPLTSVGKFDKKALRQRVQGESGPR
jgi:fatty-acyl-CoA synthase